MMLPPESQKLYDTLIQQARPATIELALQLQQLAFAHEGRKKPDLPAPVYLCIASELATNYKAATSFLLALVEAAFNSGKEPTVIHKPGEKL